MNRLRILAATLSLFLLLGHVAVQAQEADTLGNLESHLFARQFQQEPSEERLSRLENAIFGEAQKGDVTGRTRHLEQVLRVSAPMTDLAKAAPQPSVSGLAPSQAEPRVPEATDYPAVTSLEQRVLHQAYPGEDVASRLKRLEQQVFHQSYDELPMVDRVDQLTLKVMPGSALGVEEGAINGLPNKSSDFTGSNVAVYSQVTALEEQILGRSYGGDMLTNRLSRLEQTVFGGPHGGSVDNRVEQLIARYPSRMQQSNWQSPNARFQKPGPYRFGDMSSRVNRAVGQSLSPEMISQLPPSVRSQVQQGALPPPEQYNTPPGMLPEGQMTWSQTTEVVPLQTYTSPQSLYQMPGNMHPPTYGSGSSMYSGSTPLQSYGQSYGTPLSGTGQVILPQQMAPQQSFNYMNPTAEAMGMNGQIPQQQMFPQQMMPQQPNNMSYGQPMLPMGQPSSMIQSVSVLESQVFGRTYDGSTLIYRLENLEKNVFGKTYPQLAPQQRINRLMNKSTPQSALPTNPLNRLLGKKGKNGKGPNILQSVLGGLMSSQQVQNGTLPQQNTDAYGNAVDPYGNSADPYASPY